MIIVNCRSIQNKVYLFLGLISTVKPSLVLGTESWLDESIQTSKFFRLIFRFSVSVLRFPEYTFRFCCASLESVWAHIFVEGMRFAVGVYYRPPVSVYQCFNTVKDIISLIPNESIIASDFNLPGLLKSNGKINAPHTVEHCEFLNLVNIFGFRQHVTEPTRERNILDLLLLNTPNIFSTKVIPRIRDHSCVTAELHLPDLVKCVNF